MLTHGEELGLSPKRTSSIMLTLWVIKGAIRQELLPFLVENTHYYSFVHSYSGSAIYNTNGVPKAYTSIYQPHTISTSNRLCQIIRHRRLII